MRRQRTGPLVCAAVAALALAPSAHAVLPQQSGPVDLLTQGNVRIDGAAAGDNFGSSVASAGDFNGDGRPDVIIGAPGGPGVPGQAYVIVGQPLPPVIDLAAGVPGLRLAGGANGDQAGIAVSGAGDVNGDGFSDVIVGAWQASTKGGPSSHNGAAYVVFGRLGSSGVLNLGTAGFGGFRIDGAAASDEAGNSVAGAGDVNGDGLADLIVAARGAASNAGAAYVVFGKTTSTTVDLASLGGGGFAITGGAAGDVAGRNVAGLGDMNGDGRADVAVGAPGAQPAGASSGSAYVIYGKASSSTINLGAALGAAGFRINGTSGDQAGIDLAAPGDLTGDGVPDVIVGANGADPLGRTTAGAAFVVAGRKTPSTVNLGLPLDGGGFEVAGAAAGDQTGYSDGIAPVGDVNGDGRPDLLVGGFGAHTLGRTQNGTAYLAFAPFATPVLDLAAPGAVRFDGASDITFLGAGNSAAGDINGDGRPDFLLGASGEDRNARNNSGSAYIEYGFGPPEASYPAITATAGKAIAPVTPTFRRTGDPSFSSSPPLPAGVTLNAFTGTISGTPAAPDPVTGVSAKVSQPTRSYRISMTDLAGTVTATLSLRVNPAPGACANRATGTKGRDRLLGSLGGDRLLGGKGNDRIRGVNGNDCLYGQAGNDRVLGDSGRDKLYGGAGRDTLKGGTGKDLIDAGPGNDTIDAVDRTKDTVRCGRGVDRVRADRGDKLVGCEKVKRVGKKRRH
jgi:FG-GAP repeat/RTX calcium-binding nonapeptide repeat (4 copies)/Putative Ig domain